MTDATRTVPISSHPAFKWWVGVWFALLLGLGLFVMPATVHQSLVERLGLDGVLTGATAQRAILSSVAALVGFAIGLVLAMRVTAIGEAASDDIDAADDTGDVWLHDGVDAPSSAIAADAPRRPFNPREDIDEEGIAVREASSIMGNATEETLAHDTPEDAIFADVAESDEMVAMPEEAQGEQAPAPDFYREDEHDRLHIERFGQGFDDPEVEEEARQDETVVAPEPHPEAPVDALGDLSLDALTERLGAALQAFKAASAVESEPADPVIAFLRREAEREHPEPSRHRDAEDPQAELRSALDKLNRLGKHK